jgi:hypothetical protein
MKKFERAAATVVLLALFAPVLCRNGPTLWAGVSDSDALFSRTALEKLVRDFPQPDVSYLLYDLRSATIIASRWTAPGESIPIGSLVKPFTALAYAESHDFRFPDHVCNGGNSCWLPNGHGRMGIVRAVAFSCNAYFSHLASGTTGAQVTSVAQRLGLRGPGANASPEIMAGRFGLWRESPEAVVRAYAMLLDRRSQPGIRDIVDGMRLAASEGTAAALSRHRQRQSILAKTATAPCTHKEHAPGDGFVLVAWPSDSPRYLQLVRQHGVPGAKASVLAARMLHALEP